ncbi:hypothetical protein Bcoa_0575 [Heyndrickxia coagulans 36D1]|uniref:Uncharacterized protein n=1 Tax=Heyndrickxia coagulans 36D1 TaxID=345219 RepID=G2TQF0_HEYCO|nr:hypothetical protein Bcoa_0575 [Heyndrickxia coagulans 36D1]
MNINYEAFGQSAVCRVKRDLGFCIGANLTIFMVFAAGSKITMFRPFYRIK